MTALSATTSPSIPPAQGLFISFEGIDGAGKSSHIEGLAEQFRRLGRSVTQSREPGGTPLAETLRDVVLHQAMDPLTEALLLFAARRDHLVTVIEPALARGEVLLCDRFTDATFAYQGGGRGFDWAVLSQLEQWVQGLAGLPRLADASGASGAPAAQPGPNTAMLRQPDLTLWFDLPPAIAAARLAGARAPDRFEAEPVAFFEKVQAAYARRMAQAPDRFVRINSDQQREAVAADVAAAVRRKLSF